MYNNLFTRLQFFFIGWSPQLVVNIVWGKIFHFLDYYITNRFLHNRRDFLFMNLANGGRSIQVQDGEACTFLEEGTPTCCTRSSVGRTEYRLLEVEDIGRRQALGGRDWHDGEGCTFFEEGTSCCGTRSSVGGEDRLMSVAIFQKSSEYWLTFECLSRSSRTR